MIPHGYLASDFDWFDNEFYGRIWTEGKIMSFWRIKEENFGKRLKELESILKERNLLKENENLFTCDLEFKGYIY